jgi:glycerate kinase
MTDISKLRELRATLEDYRASGRQGHHFVAFDLADKLLAVCEAAQAVLDGLNARIDTAPANAVPVFDGIAELHSALSALEERERT